MLYGKFRNRPKIPARARCTSRRRRRSSSRSSSKSGSSLAPYRSLSSLSSRRRRLHSRFSASLGPASQASRRFLSRSAHSSASFVAPLAQRPQHTSSIAFRRLIRRPSPPIHKLARRPKSASSLQARGYPILRDVQATIRVGGEDELLDALPIVAGAVLAGGTPGSNLVITGRNPPLSAADQLVSLDSLTRPEVEILPGLLLNEDIPPPNPDPWGRPQIRRSA